MEIYEALEISSIVLPKMYELLEISSVPIRYVRLPWKISAAASASWDHNNVVTMMGIRVDVSQIRDRRHLAQCLAHEVTHIKQYVKKELYPAKVPGQRIYRGEVYNFEPTDPNRSALEYYMYPWEIEARGMEQLGVYFLK